MPSNSSANEKSLNIELPVYSNGLSVYNSPSQLLYSRKEVPLLYFPDLPMAFTIAHLPGIIIPLLLPNKRFLLVK